MRARRSAPLLVALALAVSDAHSTAEKSRGPRHPPLQTTAPAAQERAYRANNVGVAHLEQFDYEAAARSFGEALELSPGLSIARLNLAIALFYGGKPAEAAVEARAAVESLPASPHAHYVAGLIAKAEDRLDDAVAEFARVIALDPADAGAKVNLGQIHLQRRNYQEALSLFQEALAAEPYNVTAAYSVALALIRSGQGEQGREAMQRFETLRDSAYGVTYAQLYLSQGRYGEAIASTGAEADLVSPAPPDVTFSEAFSLTGGAAAAGGKGGVTLFDADGDGDLDLLDAGAGVRLLRNQQGAFAEAERDGFAGLRDLAVSGAVAGDYDNDGRPDLLLVTGRGAKLFHQQADGSFQDVTGKAGLPQAAERSEIGAAAFADVDHDGDLDLVLAGAPTQLLRNNANGTFTDITKEAGLVAALPRAVAVAASDFDNRRDIDLVVLAGDRTPLLYRNMRDGTFRDAAAEAGLPPAAAYTALTAGDINKDGYTDFFFARADAPGAFAMSDGRGAFRVSVGPEASAGATAAQLVDYDNDGLLDLLTLSARHPRLFRNVGSGKWFDATEHARLSALQPSAGRGFDAMALGDIDGDGATDVVVRTTAGEVRAWRNQGGRTHASLRVRPTGRVSNRSAIGAKVEVRAGSLRQLRETSASTPAIAPADLVFGLGARASADVVRILWPSGILQAETELGPASSSSPVVSVTELDRKPSSCPYLFTWNGTRFEFVTDFMGGGEMGAWLAPGTWNRPDPDEYVRIRGDQLQPRDGRYELRVTNELEEALFVDRLQLVAVDHPEGVEVVPNEGLRSAPRPFGLTVTRNARPPVRAVDDHGHDVLPQLTAIDRRYPDDFDLLPIRGYAAPHTLTLDLGTDSDDVVLLMTGWTDYAFSNDNVAASQHGAAMHPPSIEVKDPAGRWRTVVPDTGFPVGRPQTVPVSLKGKFLSASRELRISTTMRIYWDQILVDTSGGAFPTRITRLDPAIADLRERGFSSEVTPDGREPFGYDYQRVSAASPWKVMVGRYTRVGDVRTLLHRSDDMFVISRPGDEIALSFDASRVPPLPRRWTRTFLLYADGFSKEMNPRSASPDSVGPLPFHGMTGYPYGPAEHYPRSAAHRDYLERYNTRIVSRPIPSIDTALMLERQRR